MLVEAIIAEVVMFFNISAFGLALAWLLSRPGVTAPIVPGIMPISNFTQLRRFSEACGAEIPRWVRSRLEGFGDYKASIQAFGLDVVSDLCERLRAGGAPGVHFYTMNQAEPTLALL